ncbi:MAG: Ppx/GppA phosphatase family protein [Leptospiraceae bacterium]|nr:Ppx/GppA phosphatase family protein [Leptospiraceae bacterium]
MFKSERNLAAIDLGTNSFHIIIVKVKSDGTFESLGKERESVRLGSGGSNDSVITPDAIERGLQCLKRFKALADVQKADIRAVATSALREAKNRDVFLKRAEQELGLHLEVISGFEEARLIYYGILQGIPVFDKRILMVDIGGGSTEILIGEKGEVLFAQSLKIGAVRLTDKFFYGDPDQPSEIKQCRYYVEGMLSPLKREIEKWKPEIVIGSSGTIQAMANLTLVNREDAAPRSLNNYQFTAEECFKVREILSAADTLKKRTKIPGLDSKRADIIVAGSIILEEVFKAFSLKSMTVSEYALREGIIYDTIKKQEGDNKEHSLANIRLKAINSLFESFPYEKEHVETVRKLSLKIFDDLQAQFSISKTEREYLEAASMLHEIGFGISHSSHHKHSYYIIRNSELMVGFNFEEIEMIALIARYHRKSPPKAKHVEFNALSSSDQNIVKRMGGILRIADGLDRSHQSIVEDLKCEIQNDLVIFKVKVRSKVDPHIDIWSAQQKRELFEEAFSKKAAFVVV